MAGWFHELIESVPIEARSNPSAPPNAAAMRGMNAQRF
jgi:hypothetical protein